MVRFLVFSTDPCTEADASSLSRRDREDMKRCWGFLDATSRSFSAVIKELEGDLSRVVSLLQAKVAWFWAMEKGS
jgi:hypothetical protein